MNRLVPVLLVLAVALTACVPGLAPVSGPASEATGQAYAATLAGMTMAALPTQTPLPTNTAAPSSATSTHTKVPPSATVTAPAASATSATTSAIPSGTITVTSTLSQTGTIPAATLTATGTPSTPVPTVTGTPPTATPTDELVPREYGTQPPYIHYGRVHLVNQANRDVYVSFQCTTPEGYLSIVEYPVFGRITVSVPAGRCEWVAWVGGRQFTGMVGISRFEELTMTFKKDSVTIK